VGVRGITMKGELSQQTHISKLKKLSSTSLSGRTKVSPEQKLSQREKDLKTRAPGGEKGFTKGTCTGNKILNGEGVEPLELFKEKIDLHPHSLSWRGTYYLLAENISP